MWMLIIDGRACNAVNSGHGCGFTTASHTVIHQLQSGWVRVMRQPWLKLVGQSAGFYAHLADWTGPKIKFMRYIDYGYKRFHCLFTDRNCSSEYL